jgi:TPR repeat protein
MDESGVGTLGTSSSAAATKRGDQAREMIRKIRGREGKVDLEELFHHAEQFRDEGLLVDAHLMYFFAAKQGHAESALVLGVMYDPEHTLEIPSVIEKPDWGQAHKWYFRAAEAGNEIARERLEYLRKQVERAAVEGDREAGRLVLQWQ